MPGMSIREFKSDLCDQPFTMPSGDLMVPEPNVCDDCLREVWDMEDEVLTTHTAGYLAPGEVQATVDSIIQYIKTHRKQWGEAEEAIRLREWACGALGG